MANPDVTRWAPLARKYGKQYGVSPSVLLGLIQVESGGVPNRTSPKGAQGLTQFMPATAQQYGVKIGDHASEIRGAAQYLSDLGYRKDPVTALAKYNGGTHPPQESYGYARQVLHSAGSYGNPSSYTPQSTGPGPSAPSAPAPAQTLIQTLQRPQSTVSSPPAPAFSARVVQPAGYQAPPGVNPNPQPDLRQQLMDTLRQPADIPLAPPVTQGAQGPAAPRLPGVGTNYGRVVVAPGANRKGVDLQRPVLAFLQQTAGIFGKPIQITTGTNHNQFVAGTNRQSDHWEGNAVDIAVPVDGARGDRIAASALEAAGVAPQRAQEMASKGGLYNLNVNGRRLQVIWKTNEGGNHHDHVHIGYR